MYVRYKKNIQENDLPRKRVRKASKIAGSGGQYLEIRYPERGRKQSHGRYETAAFYLEIRYPERGRKLNDLMDLIKKLFGNNLEIRYPERGRKRLFKVYNLIACYNLEIRYPERGRKPFSFSFPPFLYIYNLEIRYPERGRKLFKPTLLL